MRTKDLWKKQRFHRQEGIKKIPSKAICLFLFLNILFTAWAAGTGASPPLKDEAGFIHIEPITFYFHYGSYFNRLELTSTDAQIWYSFHAADENAAQKPLFVFFNGGPGSATSSGLLSMYTSPFTLDNSIDSGGGDEFIENPVSWTRLGSLLHIDARQAGFSYNTMPRVEIRGERIRQFNAQNFNSFFDAADFIRVLLRFLARHPQIRGNPIVIVGESYGGTRAIAMLHILLNYSDYGNDSEMYQDKALSREIQNHYDTVFPGYIGQVAPPEIISGQFGFLILIQPTVSMGYQNIKTAEMLLSPGSIIDQLGEETGIPYDPSTHGSYFNYLGEVIDRDIYMYAKPKDWLFGFFNNAGSLLQTTKNLGQVTGTDVTAITGLYASERADAYRLVNPEDAMDTRLENISPFEDMLFFRPARLEARLRQQDQGDMNAVFGNLMPWDRYFMDSNYDANQAFYYTNVAMIRGYEVVFTLPRFGRMFLQNTAHVHTFITNAAYDLVVYTNALPPALTLHSDILELARHQKDQPENTERPGQIFLTYRPSAFPGISNLVYRTIRFPFYASSGHAVSLSQPYDFFSDVSSWLWQEGINKGIHKEKIKNDRIPYKDKK